MWSVMPAFGAAAYVPALVLERALFVRERSDGLYRVGGGAPARAGRCRCR
jgi:hypothetical protein